MRKAVTMTRWRKRRRLGGAEPAPLTPAQVQHLVGRQDSLERWMLGWFIAASFAGAASHALLFWSVDSQAYRLIIVVSCVDAILLAIAFILARGGRPVVGATMALAVASLHMLWVCIEISAGVSVESYLFAFAIAPFVMIGRERAGVRMAVSSLAMAVYIVCELGFPEGSGQHPLDAGIAHYFAMSNRVISGTSVLVLVAVIQINMSTTRHILEGAARYGELRATTDELTGVYNRRPIIAQLSEWVTRGRGNYAIALIDLDNFKTINDEFGHDCGDVIIQTVALTLRSHFRENDMVSRWGGDEFLVLMPGVRHADLLPVLDRLRHAVSQIEKRCDEHVHRVTVSVGAAMGAVGQTPDECIAAADHALYRAKAEGRNKVIAVGIVAHAEERGRTDADDDPSWPPGYTSLR